MESGATLNAVLGNRQTFVERWRVRPGCLVRATPSDRARDHPATGVAAPYALSGAPSVISKGMNPTERGTSGQREPMFCLGGANGRKASPDEKRLPFGHWSVAVWSAGAGEGIVEPVPVMRPAAQAASV